MTSQIEHFQLRPLDLPLLTEVDVLGAVVEVNVSGEPQRLLWPRPPADGGFEGGLVAPAGCEHAAIDSILIDGYWGEAEEQMNAHQASVHGFVLVATLDPTTVPAEFDPGLGHQLGGQWLDQLSSARKTWTSELVRWIETLTGQSMHLHNPGLQTLSRPSSNPLEWVAADGRPTGQRTPSQLTASIWSDDEVESERLLNLDGLELAAARSDSGTPVPLAMELRSNAHIATRRGERRLAATEIGTACEAWLTSLLRLDPDHGKTLGGLVTEATSRGLGLPADAKSGLVDVRNDAVHRGTTPTLLTTRRSLEIAEQIWKLADPDVAGVTARLRGTSRPQRQDLIIFTGPAKS